MSLIRLKKIAKSIANILPYDKNVNGIVPKTDIKQTNLCLLLRCGHFRHCSEHFALYNKIK